MKPIRLPSIYKTEDLALEVGAKVAFADGRKFNTEGVKVTKTSTPVDLKRGTGEPVAKPAPEPVAQVDLSMELMQQMIALMNRPAAAPVVSVPAPVVNIPEAKPTKAVSWTFDFIRNADGTLKSIKATPQE